MTIQTVLEAINHKLQTLTINKPVSPVATNDYKAQVAACRNLDELCDILNYIGFQTDEGFDAIFELFELPESLPVYASNCPGYEGDPRLEENFVCSWDANRVLYGYKDGFWIEVKKTAVSAA